MTAYKRDHFKGHELPVFFEKEKIVLRNAAKISVPKFLATNALINEIVEGAGDAQSSG